ncbi:MAG TPA: hypothetical protein VH207_13675 [Chthoniobacterales bacterium]|jgi:hypothetical protein|nr:hypothetical protein [Chthoniobacterales bacterium]
MQLYNRGIRRRLAPMLGNRAQLELAYSLLFSLPGTPVLRYGDEIGMGDDLSLTERNAVRTPMPWSNAPLTAIAGIGSVRSIISCTAKKRDPLGRATLPPATMKWVRRVSDFPHQRLKTRQGPHPIPLGVGLEIAQHRVALAVRLLETIEGALVFLEAIEDQRGKMRRHIIMPPGAPFELGQALAREVRAPSS